MILVCVPRTDSVMNLLPKPAVMFQTTSFGPTMESKTIELV